MRPHPYPRPTGIEPVTLRLGEKQKAKNKTCSIQGAMQKSNKYGTKE